MDDVDRALIGALRANGRASIAELASALAVSRGTVTNRMARLEREGVIVGYTATVASDADLSPIRAWMCLRVEGTATGSVLGRLLSEPGVTHVFDTNGHWDLLAELETESTTALSEVLNRIRQIPGIAQSETNIHLATLA